MGHVEQPVVGHDDKSVHALAQLGDAGFRKARTAAALKAERLGDHRHCEDAHFARGLGDDGNGARAGAAAHTGGQIDHVGALHVVSDLADRLARGQLANFRPGSGSESLGGVLAQHYLAVGLGLFEVAHVGVCGNKLHAFDALRDYVVKGVAAAAADGYDFNDFSVDCFGFCLFKS